MGASADKVLGKESKNRFQGRKARGDTWIRKVEVSAFRL